MSKFFSLKNTLNGVERAKIYRHNDDTVKGLYYGEKFESYVDIIFNQRDEVSKLYQTIKWITNVTNQAKGNEVFKTITHIMLYNDSQCSGKTNLKDNHFELTRNDEGEWDFNDFRDLVIDTTLPFIDEYGRLIDTNINKDKLWFDKSNFISKFMVVRLIIDNVDNDDVHIHQVNVKSLISNR